MNVRLRIATIAFFCVGTVGAIVNAQTTSEQPSTQSLYSKAIEAAVARVEASVVQIETIGGLESVQGVQTNTGPTTGVVVSDDGYIVSSSFNFIQKPASIFVRDRSGTRHIARLVGSNPSRNLVLLKADSEKLFQPAKSVEKKSVQVGQTVIAVGRTYSDERPNLSIGIVSATNRIWGRAVQTDAKISPANFGGPLIDLHGNVVGILVPLSPDAQTEVAGVEWYDSGIGFAVPLDEISGRLEQWIEQTELESGTLGIALRGTDQYSDSATVAALIGVSPAAKAGIRVGDEIIRVNAHRIQRQSELKHALGPMYRGDSIKVGVQRDGQILDFNVELIGLSTPVCARQIGVLPRHGSNSGARDRGGLSVRQVIAGSAAELAGVEPGDVIRSVDSERLESWSQLRQYLLNRSIGDAVSLSIVRDEEEISVEVEVQQLKCAAALKNLLSMPGDSADCNIVEIKVPESTNEVFAIIPPPKGVAPGLLVWVVEPGAEDRAAQIKRWREVSANQNFVILVAFSKDSRKWTSAEVETIETATRLIAKRAPFVADRVVIGGQRTAAVIAALAGTKNRKLFKGVMMVDAALPRRISKLTNDPMARQMFYFGTTRQFADTSRLENDTQRLEKAFIPYTVDSIDESKDGALADSIAHWIDAVDRL